MKEGPKKLQKIAADVDAATRKQLAEVNAELAKLERDKKAVEKKFGDGDEYNYDRLIAKASGFMAQAQLSFIEVGRCLLRIKAGETVEAYQQGLDRIGIARSTAYMYIRAAVRFGQTDRLKALPLRKLDILGQLTEGEIRDLDQKGSLGELTVDDLDRMSAEELRRTLRAERARELKRRKKAEEQFYQVKNERDHLRDNAGTSPEYDRYSGAATRAIAKIINMDLSAVDVAALDQFMQITGAQLAQLSKRAHPENWTMDCEVEQGKIEAADRRKKKGE